jgi:hypothetical protein
MIIGYNLKTRVKETKQFNAVQIGDRQLSEARDTENEQLKAACIEDRQFIKAQDKELKELRAKLTSL